MIMKVPDCLLKEYISEIDNRYGVKVSVGRLSDILKELGITHKKVPPVANRLIAACKRGRTERPRTQRCLGSKNCRMEPRAGDFS